MALEKLHGAIHRFRAPLSTPRLGPWPDRHTRP